MGKRLFFGLVTLTIAFSWLSCGAPEKEDSRISEGVITYSAELVDISNSMAELAPSKMTVKFKNNKTAVQMNAGMGILTLTFISNPESKTFTQMVKFTGNPSKAVIQNAEEIQKENELFNIEVIPTNQTKIIAGYKCKKARIHYKGGEPIDYDIYYTNELNINNSNFSNPYYKLDGVLMEYRIKKAGLEMQFVATSVTKETVDDTTFEIPPDTKIITMEELSEILTSFQ